MADKQSGAALAFDAEVTSLESVEKVVAAVEQLSVEYVQWCPAARCLGGASCWRL